jgi:Trypsin
MLARTFTTEAIIDLYRKKKISLHENLPKTRNLALENREELFQDKIIFDLSRLEIISLKNRLYSCIGMIYVYNLGPEVSNLTTWGTGTLIAPNLVITAAHVLDSKGLKHAKVQSVSFSPGTVSEGVNPFGVIRVKEWIVHPTYNYDDWNLSKPGSDIAILVLEEAVGSKTGFLKLKSYEETELKAMTFLRVSGKHDGEGAAVGRSAKSQERKKHQ